jgi:hypothetical protein
MALKTNPIKIPNCKGTLEKEDIAVNESFKSLKKEYLLLPATRLEATYPMEVFLKPTNWIIPRKKRVRSLKSFLSILQTF